MSTEKLATKSDLQEMYSRIRPYLGGSADAGFTPIGTIISVMGNSAPANYLACNGQTVNIADYPELANYFLQQFGSKNKFGGNGTTTFGIPDLRGEFLRGTGTNSHTNQGSGANVGTHQNATEHFSIANHSDANAIYTTQVPNSNWIRPTNSDTLIPTKFNIKQVNSSPFASTSEGLYTSRPTNTSVLYCIATKNIYLNPSNDYSTDEKVVGTWIDGSTLYQRTLTGTVPTPSEDGTAASVVIANLSNIIIRDFRGGRTNSNGLSAPLIYSRYREDTQKDYINCWVYLAENGDLNLHNSQLAIAGNSCWITIQYTKTT